MNKNNIIMAAAAVALLVGATDVAMAHGQNGPQQANAGGTANNNNVQKVNVKINNIVAVASNTNSNTNNNVAANVNTSSSASSNTSNNSSAATNTNTGGNTSTNTNTNNSSASATATSGATGSSGSGGGSSDVTVEGDETAASSAAPIFLSTGDDVCMGSSSVGGQAAEFGFSVGSTWEDKNCMMLKNARELKNQGHDKAAKARLCMDEDNALAFELAGEPCPRALASTQAAIAKIRAWNPDYDPERVAAASPTQLASLDRTVDAGGEQVAFLPPASKADAAWLSGGFESFVGAIKAFFQSLSDAGKHSQPTGSPNQNWALDLPE